MSLPLFFHPHTMIFCMCTKITSNYHTLTPFLAFGHENKLSNPTSPIYTFSIDIF